MTATSKNDLRRNSLIIHWFPVVVLCAAIFIQSCFPTFDSKPDIPHWDKFLHAGVYGLLAALFFRAGRRTWHPRVSVFGLLCISIAFTGLYGASDELHQSLVAARSADAFDLVADIVGGIVGAVVAMVLLHWHGSRRSMPQSK